VTRLEQAIAAIDARNQDDPNTLTVNGVAQPKELTHARMVTAWVLRMAPDASEALLLAARAHHLRRWEIPRDSYPEGRTAYLQWRRALQDLHARELRTILEATGYDAGTIARAEHIVRKRELARDPEVRILEDALCLTFLETQFAEVARKLDEEKLIEVLRKTARKMSPLGIEHALALDLPAEQRALLARAL
jgi:hypothetical protein